MEFIFCRMVRDWPFQAVGQPTACIVLIKQQLFPTRRRLEGKRPLTLQSHGLENNIAPVEETPAYPSPPLLSLFKRLALFQVRTAERGISIRKEISQTLQR